MPIEVALVFVMLGVPVVWTVVLLVNALIHDARERRQVAAACRRIAERYGDDAVAEVPVTRHRPPQRRRRVA